jgi:phosphatidate phosphatase APP1
VYVLAITLLSLVAFLPVVHECVYASLEESNTPKITQPALLSITVTYDPIDRGNRQTVTAEVFDPQSKQGISGVNIKGTVTYASLLPIYEFNGKTDGNGNFSYSWTIDRDAEPGTFIVVVAATSEQHSLRLVESTMFEVRQDK